MKLSITVGTAEKERSRRGASSDTSFLNLDQSLGEEGKGEDAPSSSVAAVGVAMGVVSLLVLILVLAMCGGRGDTFDPGQTEASRK